MSPKAGREAQLGWLPWPDLCILATGMQALQLALSHQHSTNILSPADAHACDHAAGIGPSDGEGGGSVWLKRAFSMLEQEDVEVDLEQLDTLAKVGTGVQGGVQQRGGRGAS